MYRVIVADDEESIRNRICLMLDKLGDDFEVIGKYENGFDALESGIPLEPDLIITDIKMPYISGIDLIKQARIELPLIKAVIISGYDSFDYAKEAISLGVVSYLTKPLSFDEFKETMMKVKDSLDAQQKNANILKHMEEQEKSFVNYIKADDLTKLVTLKVLSDNFILKLKEDGINLDYKYQLIAIFDSDSDELSYENLDLMYTSLLSLLIDEMSSSYKIYTFKPDNQLAALIMSNDKIVLDDLIFNLNKICAKIKKFLKCTVSCGLSNVASQSINYRKLFRHARRALEFRTVLGSNLVLPFEELKKSNPTTSEKIDENEYKLLSYYVAYSKKKEAKEKINLFIDQISTPQFKDNYYFILSNILDSILKSCISLAHLYQNFESQIEMTQNIYTIKTKEVLADYLYKVALAVIKVNEEQRLSGVESSYDRIKHYIQAHFSECDLSIDDVADELAYSISYISAILKKNNTSFTKLTTEFRMEKAKELLLNPDTKIISVANDVGYSDPYYFSHCFKKYYGQSPDEFKKNQKI